MKYHIEKNSVQETLVIPLLGRLICSERFPQLFSDPEAKHLCDSLDYDFSEKRGKMESVFGLFGALEVAQRQYDLRCEAEAYLQAHPGAAVVNLGCGLDDTFRKCDNGRCRGYNIDLPDVIAVRNELLPQEAGSGTSPATSTIRAGWMRWTVRTEPSFLRQASSITSGQRKSEACSPAWRNVSPVPCLFSMPATGGARK